MTSHIQLLSSVQIKKEGTVIFGDNNKGKVIGIGMVGNFETPYWKCSFDKRFKHNLLSISQLCGKGYKIIFEKDACLIYDTNMKDILFKGSVTIILWVIWLIFHQMITYV